MNLALRPPYPIRRGGDATSGGSGAAAVAGAGQIEVENNQLAQTVPPPAWLSGFKLPGYTGESRNKEDSVIADPATQLDPSMTAGPLVTPNPGPRAIETLITAATPDWLKTLVTDAVTIARYNPNSSSVGNMKAFLNSPGFGSQVQDASQKTNYQFQGQSVYKATQVAGLYDDQGNTKQGMPPAEKTAHNIWSDVAILPATPFAAATALPPQVWNAIAAILQVLK